MGVKLSEILNAPVTIKLGDLEIECRRASLSDHILGDDFANKLVEEKSGNAIIKSMVYRLWLCSKKVDGGPATWEDLMLAIPLEAITSNKSNTLRTALETLGFLPPQPATK